MKRLLGYLLLPLAVAGATACTPIRPWPVIVPIPAETLIPPSHELAEYTSGQGLALQIARTTQHCGVVKQAIAREIDQRDGRLTTTRRALLLIGSAAALASTVYTGVEETPKKGISIPLSAISGGTLVSAIPVLGQDERAAALREKIAAIRRQETAALGALGNVERELLNVSLLRLEQALHAEGSAEYLEVQQRMNVKYEELAPLEEGLRTSLAVLANECS